MTVEPFRLHDLLDPFRSEANRIAIVDGDREITYAAFASDVDRLAGRLVAAGLRPGDRVGILLPKSYEECVAIFAASRAGGVFVPINPVLKPAQVGHILADSGARVLVSRPAILDGLGSMVPALPDLLATIDPTRHDDAGVAVLPPSPAIGEDLGALLYTSGSTGSPKGVMLSHRNLLAGTRIVRSYLSITADDRILSILPFSFDYGLNQLLTVVEQGARIVLFQFRLGDEIVSAVARHEITGLAGVPTLWAILTRAAPSLARTPLPTLRYITNSGGAVPTATVRRLCDVLPQTRIFLMYGLTEAFRSTFLDPSEVDRRPTSIGKAIPECEVYPVTADGRRARPNEPGILVHRGPTVSLGYWNRPDETARVIRPDPERPPERGGSLVCYSGDLVTMDDEGFLHFVARDNAMIKSAGFRISPTEVEETLMATGVLRQVAVIGLPDEWVGQKVHAVAVPLPEANPIAVLQAAAASLPAHMVPGRIEFVDELPTSPNGKVDYKRLVAERTP